MGAKKIEEQTPVRIGDVWEDAGVTWRVVSEKDGVYGMSGPGPCRGMQYKTAERIQALYTLRERSVRVSKE